MAAERQESAEKQAIESGVDVLLVLLYAPGSTGKYGEPVRGTTRLQKLLFLLWKEGRFYQAIPNLYGFEAYDFRQAFQHPHHILQRVRVLSPL